MSKNQTNSTSRVQKHRAKLRKAGMKPIQVWVPDTQNQAFIEECRRQSRLVAQFEDEAVMALLDEAANEVEGWE